MLDPAWPAGLRTAAEVAVEAAVDAGELRDGRLAFFTSGSSGRPRGVLRSVASWQASVEPLSQVTGIGAGHRVWLPGSPTSTLTLYAGWHALAVGAELAGAGGWPGADPPHGVTAVHADPRTFEAVVRSGERGQLPELRVAVVAGGFLPGPTRVRAERLGWRVVEYYGAAELSFVAWRADSAAYQRFPGVETEARDGEIWVRSPYLADGYLDPTDPGPLRQVGGWATVGDLGRSGADGLTVLGRGDAAVTSGGRTIVVEEVESVIRAAGQVDDVVVTGIPHPLLGQLLVAVVAGADPSAVRTRADLEASCTGLPAWSVPRRWWLVEELPRTSSGKPDRSAVRAGIVDGSLTPRPLR